MTNLLRQSLACAILILGCALAAAQPVAWQHITTGSNSPKMTRDPSGNIYLAYRTASFGARQLRMKKINPLGTVVWDSLLVQDSGNIDIQYNIREVIYAHSSATVLFQERAGGGTGALVFSYGRRVDATNGVSTQMFSSTVEAEGIAAYSDKFAVIGFSGGQGRLFRTGINGGNFGNLALPNFSRADDLVCQPDGTALIAGTRANGTVSIVKVNPDDSFVEYNFDNTSRTSETMTRLVLDTNANKVYGFGSGLFNASPTDQDVVCYTMNLDGSSQANQGFGAATMDYPGEISVAQGGGVVISYFADTVDPNSTIVRKLSSALGVAWTTPLSGAIQGYGRSHAEDADGNLLVMDPMLVNGNTNIRVSKLNPVTGAVMLSTLYLQANTIALQMLADAAGNYYCTADQDLTTHLFRLQPAVMGYTTNTVQGGTSVTGTITLSAPAPSDQVWTLASVNPAAASVPPTVTVALGNMSADFNISTTSVTANTNVGISARFEGFIMQKTLTVLTPTVSALSISPNVVIGGVNTAGLVTISGAAPTGGKTVNLTSSNTAAATVPASVVIPAGSTSFGFGITTFGVTANRGVVITATTGAVSKTAFFAVNAPSLLSVSMNPSTVKGGLQSAMTVTLDGIAPTGGRSVVIFSGAPAIVFAPASVTVPAGSANITQNLVTAPVTSSTNVLIFATRSGIYKTATMTVTP